MSAARRELITLAREARELTQEALAKAAGVAQGTISKAENGQIALSDELVAAIAKALDFPISFFSQELRAHELPPSLFRRRLTGVAQRTLRAVRAHWAIMLRNLAVLLAPVDFPEVRVHSIDLRAQGITPSRAAQDLRVQWHVPLGPIANLTNVIEQAGVLVVPFDFGTDRVDGMSVYDRQLDLPPVIFCNTSIPGDRQRFTLAHELGHLMMHSHLPLVAGDAEEVEAEADAFAAELLLPTADVRGHLLSVNLQSLCGLKLYWKVSIQSLLMKAELLNLIPESRARYLWAEIGRRGYRLREPNPIPREEPTLLRQLIQLHEQQLGYTEDELCNVLCINKSDLRTRYPVTHARGLRLV